jgi:lysophospholipid acyltransferase
MLLHPGPINQVWRQVYYYEIFTSFGAMAFFYSPAKAILAKKIKAMARPGVRRVKSDQPDVMLGVPGDPEKELQDITAEIKAEIERRKKEGLSIPDVRALVNEKLAEMEKKQS